MSLADWKDLIAISTGVFQIAFFSVTATIVSLTFLKAKDGLLNTINTEYHKRIIENLYNISADLFSEFDHTSERVLLQSRDMDELFNKVRSEIREMKSKGSSDQELLRVGVPIISNVIRLKSLSDKYKSDPFLPEGLRAEIVRYFEDRWNGCLDAHSKVARQYIEDIASGMKDINETSAGYHNEINALLYKKGVGISQLEERAHKIRHEISAYLGMFNVVLPGAGRKVADAPKWWSSFSG